MTACLWQRISPGTSSRSRNIISLSYAATLKDKSKVPSKKLLQSTINNRERKKFGAHEARVRHRAINRMTLTPAGLELPNKGQFVSMLLCNTLAESRSVNAAPLCLGM